MYSKGTYDHISHINHIFERCRKYEISQNPKKSTFVGTKGKLVFSYLKKVLSPNIGSLPLNWGILD